MKHRNGFGTFAFVFAAAVLGSLSGVPGAGALTAYAADRDIVILSTNDVHCGVEDNIGYAGLSLYKKEMQDDGYVVLVDAGDALQGAPIGTLSEGGYLVDIMNQVGFDIAVPGNHEFDYGMQRFLELSGELDCGYVSCNFMDLSTGSTVFAPYQILVFDDTKVAFVGVTTPESLTKSRPTFFQDADANYIYGFCEDATGTKLYTQVQQSVDQARAEGADYVILVAHLGRDGVTERWSSGEVVANTDGIDAVIDGHSHQVYAETFPNKDGRAVPVTQTGTKLANIGKTVIRTDGSISVEMVSSVPAADVSENSYTVKEGDSLWSIAKRELGSGRLWNVIWQANRGLLRNPDRIPVGLALSVPAATAADADGNPVDAETDRFVKQIRAQYNETLKTVIGQVQSELTIQDPATGERAVRRAETNLGDLCADALRCRLGTDIGLINGGGVRASVKEGAFTYEDALMVFPFGNMVSVARVSGQVLWDALEMGCRAVPEEGGGFLQVSGLSFTVDTSVPNSVEVDDRGNFVRVNGAYRVKNIMVGAEPLDPDQLYTVASIDYILKDGGDGKTMFQDCEITESSMAVDVDVLSSYIIHDLGGVVGDAYADPYGQGRIVIE